MIPRRPGRNRAIRSGRDVTLPSRTVRGFRRGAAVDERRLVRISKYLAKHLRHRPERIGIELDAHGWVEIDALLAATAAHGFPISREELEEVVARNDKRRFMIDGDRIRANQGHTVPVDL